MWNVFLKPQNNDILIKWPQNSSVSFKLSIYGSGYKAMSVFKVQTRLGASNRGCRRPADCQGAGSQGAGRVPVPHHCGQ